ncbi:hypothetical protein CR513_31043, partial [Mucuna pruriens]
MYPHQDNPMIIIIEVANSILLPSFRNERNSRMISIRYFPVDVDTSYSILIGRLALNELEVMKMVKECYVKSLKVIKPREKKLNARIGMHLMSDIQEDIIRNTDLFAWKASICLG